MISMLKVCFCGTIGDYLEYDNGKHGVFVGIELRLRGDNAQDARNKLSRQCFKIAADDAKATQEGDEVGWSTSGGVVGAVANHLTAVVSTKKGGEHRRARGKRC